MLGPPWSLRKAVQEGETRPLTAGGVEELWLSELLVLSSEPGISTPAGGKGERFQKEHLIPCGLEGCGLISVQSVQFLCWTELKMTEQGLL